MTEHMNYVTQDNIKDIEESVEKSLQLTDEEGKSAIVSEANQMVNALFDINLGSATDRISLTNKIESLGDDVIKKSSSSCSLLKVRIGTLSNLNDKNDSKTAIITGLEDLNYEMKKLDPSKINFDEKGLFGKISRSIKKYFEKYKTADVVIKEIFDTLEKSKNRLESDNKTLEIKQVELRNATLELQRLIDYVTYLNSALEERIQMAKEQCVDEEIIHFVEKNIVFAVLQKMQDLQQQLVVNQQGYMALEIIILNNKELMRNVKKAQTTTRAALETGIIVAAALYDQKIALKQLNILNTTTNYYIAETSKLLKTQGTDIQKQSIESGPSYETLKEAFINTFEALDEIDNFKENAIPLLKERIADFANLAETGEQRIKQMEKNK